LVPRLLLLLLMPVVLAPATFLAKRSRALGLR
jgi:hypothetical protein